MDELPSPKQLISNFGLSANKRFGQNFLLDQNITYKIAKGAGDLSGRHVIEIGPGPCGLTTSLLKLNPEKVSVIEIDKNIFPILKYLKNLVGDKLNIIENDATKVKVWEIGNAPRKIIANLPYNISTVLLFQWLENINHFESLTLMFQKEVANRIIAQPNTSSYGRMSVMVQWLCMTTKLFDLPPEAFSPPPKVTSSVVLIEPRKKPLYEAEYKKMEKTVATAFNQRRKMIRSSLKGVLGKDCENKISSIDICPEKRAEQLTIEEFCKLSYMW